MKIIDFIKNKIRQQIFVPSWYSVIINSNYLIARGISNGIRKNAHYMTGIMLDFGCGRKPYQSLFKVKQHLGIDIKNPAHSHILSQVDKFYDGKKIPFDNEYFDSVFSSEVLTHIFDIQEAILEINRVLKKDGYFLLTVPFVWKENEKPNDSVRYTSFGIKHLLIKNGFEMIQQEKSGHYFIAIIQLFNDYLYSSVIPNPGFVKFLLTILIIFPVNLCGIFLSLILPRNSDFFINNVIVARKK